MLNKLLSPVVMIIMVAVFGFGIYHFFLAPAPSDHANQRSTEALFKLSLPDQYGKQQALTQWKNKIIVLNFWATWCPPCREEMPELSALHTAHQKHNVVVLGIAIDDIKTIAQFSKESPVSYPLLSAENEGMDLAHHLGNQQGVLPYTVIINADGTIKKAFLGRVNQALIEKVIQPSP